MITAISPALGTGRNFVWYRNDLLVGEHHTGEQTVTALDLTELRDLKIVSGDVPERPAGGGGFFGFDVGGFIFGSGGGATLPAEPGVVALGFRDGTIVAVKADRDDLGELVAVAQRNAKNDAPIKPAIRTRELNAAEKQADEADSQASELRRAALSAGVSGAVALALPKVFALLTIHETANAAGDYSPGAQIVKIITFFPVFGWALLAIAACLLAWSYAWSYMSQRESTATANTPDSFG